MDGYKFDKHSVSTFVSYWVDAQYLTRLVDRQLYFYSYFLFWGRDNFDQVISVCKVGTIYSTSSPCFLLLSHGVLN